MRALQTGGGGVSIRASPCEHLSLMQRHVCTLPLQRRTTGSVLCLIQQTQSLEHAVSWPAEKNCCWWWRSWVWGVSSLLSFALFALQELLSGQRELEKLLGVRGFSQLGVEMQCCNGFCVSPCAAAPHRGMPRLSPQPHALWEQLLTVDAFRCSCWMLMLPSLPPLLPLLVFPNSPDCSRAHESPS